MPPSSVTICDYHHTPARARGLTLYYPNPENLLSLLTHLPSWAVCSGLRENCALILWSQLLTQYQVQRRNLQTRTEQERSVYPEGEYALDLNTT